MGHHINAQNHAKYPSFTPMFTSSTRTRGRRSGKRKAESYNARKGRMRIEGGDVGEGRTRVEGGEGSISAD